MHKYYNPVRVINTDNWHLELKLRLSELNISSPIIVTSPGNRKRLVLDSEFHTDSIFSDVGTNPTFNSCLRAVEFCQGKKFNGVKKFFY